MAKQNDTQRNVSFWGKLRVSLEKNKVFVDLFAAFATAAAIAGLILAGLSVRSAEQALNLAREDQKLQAAQMQPIFQVFFKREKSVPSWPVYSDIRVVSPRGTFLDAWAELNTYLVVGYYPGGPGMAAFWYPPFREAAIIPTWGFDYSSTAVSDKRGTLIQAWDGDSNKTMEKALIDWSHENQKQGLDRSKSLPSVDFVAYVKISYLDILRQPHTLYFQIGGINLSVDSLRTLRVAGRAPMLDDKIGQKCFDYTSQAGDAWHDPDSTNLLSLYDEFMKGPNKDLGKACR